MTRALLLAWLCLAAPALARADAPDTVFLDELTWTEVRDAQRAGKTTVLVPTGGTEQNGPHMALGKHNVIARHTADAIARKLGNALVAPVLAYVPEGAVEPPTGHMRFPGTITLPEAHFRSVVEWAARSLRAGGFRDVVLLGDSGGNQAGLRAVAAALTREWARAGVRVHFASDYYTAGADRDGAVARWLRAQGGRPEDAGAHAGLADTSQLMAVDPKMVRADRLASVTVGPATGVAASPTGATTAQGRRMLELRVDAAVGQITRLIAAGR